MVDIIKLGKNEQEIKELEDISGKLDKKIVKELMFLNAHQKCSEELIGDFEAKLNIVLPEEYRLFLLRYNGGKPKPDCFDDFVIDYFFSIMNLGGIYSIQSYLNTFYKRYPAEFLPIASASGGDLILIGLAGEYESKIYYWDHNYESDESGLNYYENITFITNSLHELFDQLYDLDGE